MAFRRGGHKADFHRLPPGREAKPYQVSVEEIRKAFEEAVDFYLESCTKMGAAPNKPYSGHITLRISPDLHAKLAVQAQASGSSLNRWLASALRREVERDSTV